jgi:cell division protein FtsW
LGVGLGASKQKYLFLPEAATDSIFAVIAEEIGFIGSVIIILILGVFIYEIIKIAQRAPDKFSQMLALGIASWISLQIFLNLGSIVALVPLTGVPLPFFSYG